MAFDWCVCYGIKDQILFFSTAVANCGSERPFIAIYGFEVTLPNPFCVFVGMSTLRPPPKVLPYSVRNILEGFFANCPFVVVSKTTENWIELSND